MALRQLSRTKNVAKRSTKKYLEEALYVRLFKDGGSEKSLRQQLNGFIKSHKRVFKWEVGDTLKKLRDRKLYNPALKVRLTKPLKFCGIDDEWRNILIRVVVMAICSTCLSCAKIGLTRILFLGTVSRV